MLLDNVSTLKPIIQVIDNFYKNRRLGTLIEAKVNGGKLMICSIDLSNKLEQHPEARQLKFSILEYMNSEAFVPKESIAERELKDLFVQGK